MNWSDKQTRAMILDDDEAIGYMEHAIEELKRIGMHSLPVTQHDRCKQC